MKLRVVQWNISTMSRPKGIADFIEQRIGHSPALVCLDEVKRSSYDKLVGSLNPRSSCFSLDLRMPGKNEGKERGTGIGTKMRESYGFYREDLRDSLRKGP